ncbi:MAG TPA: sigma-54 dependent transcriptional regulator [Noviherbaspirillum sp.]|nr:sigma-54 dependent transcriptional regulator [Noviherbaspirillum sp.]
MLHVSAPPSSAQPVILLRLAGCPPQAQEYVDALAAHGLSLVPCGSLESAAGMVERGCRVGLLFVTEEADLAHLDRCEPVVCDTRICWVALVAENLVGKPRMREFIADHLFNFITLPADFGQVVLALRHAWGMAYIRDTQRLPRTAPAADEMVGATPEMQDLRATLQKIARTDAPVLICGPSGSGKELAALTIHRQSSRAAAPFVAINCNAVPAGRFDAELFGDENGNPGRLQAAQGGTLFLDAAGDLPPDMQSRILDLLNENRIRRPDGRVIEADVRVMAASCPSLEDYVLQGRFREDLYYRLNVMCVRTPGLADRGPDIEAIARHYFGKFATTHNRSLRGFSKAAMNAMLSHSWPGNVRELINRVQRATVMAEGRFIQPEDLGLERPQDGAQLLSLEEARAAAERAMIRRALAHSRNQISRAASLLGVSRVTLYRLIEKYNLRSETAPIVPGPVLAQRKSDGEVRG